MQSSWKSGMGKEGHTMNLGPNPEPVTAGGKDSCRAWCHKAPPMPAISPYHQHWGSNVACLGGGGWRAFLIGGGVEQGWDGGDTFLWFLISK